MNEPHLVEAGRANPDFPSVILTKTTLWTQDILLSLMQGGCVLQSAIRAGRAATQGAASAAASSKELTTLLRTS